MATVSSKLLRAARNASLASRTAAAAASRVAAMASRSSRAAAASRAAVKASRSSRAAAAAAARAARLGLAAMDPLMSCPTRGDASTTCDDSPSCSSEDFSSDDDYDHVPDDGKTPSNKDVESDEAIWAFYSRWCEAFNKGRDHAEMVRRFKIFRHYAKHVHRWNNRPLNPKDAAKRRKAKLLIAKGEDVSNFQEWHLPMELGPFADGGDPFVYQHCKHLLEEIEES